MTRAGETDHDKELQKAFAEFKQSLRHDPLGSHDDTAPKLAAPEIVVAEPRRPLALQPKVDTRPVLGASPAEAENDFTLAAQTRKTPEEGRRRGLLYLSAAIVVSGLAAVGWTLSHGARPETTPGGPATAAVAPVNPSPDAAASTETRTQPASAESPAAGVPQSAAAPAQDTARPAALDAPPADPQPAPERAAVAPPAAAGQPIPPSAFPAAVAPTPVKSEADTTNVKQTLTPSQPETRAAAKPNSVAKPGPAVKPRVVKAKPKPAPARNAGRPEPAATSAEAPVVPPPAPVAETAPPPPSNDGALGFVKRTVNSVGSTITNLGRNAIGN